MYFGFVPEVDDALCLSETGLSSGISDEFSVVPLVFPSVTSIFSESILGSSSELKVGVCFLSGSFVLTGGRFVFGLPSAASTADEERLAFVSSSCLVNEMLKKSIATHKTINTEDKIKAAFEEIFGFLAFLWDMFLL